MSTGHALGSRAMRDGSAPVTGLPVAIVRRGEADVFRTLTERIAQLHLAEVIWDRRRAERRAAQGSDSPADRRRRDRRQAAHGTWATLGFILTAVALPGTPAPGPAIL